MCIFNDFVLHLTPYALHRNANVITSWKGDFYNGYPKLPVYSRTSTKMDTQEIVNALLDPELDDDMICSMQPVNVKSTS